MQQKTRKPDTLSPKQHQVIASLVGGNTVLDTARNFKINPATIHAWKRDNLFRATLNKMVADLVAATINRTTAARFRAIQALLDELDRPDSEPSDRIAAARVLLSLPTAPEPDQRVCSVEGLETMEREAAMDPIELLTQTFSL